MGEAAMQKHVSQHLPRREIWRENEVQTEYIGKVYATLLSHQLRQEADDVDDEQVFGNGWELFYHKLVFNNAVW